MNAENFSSFLQDPSKLYQIPYQELKSLVVQYPYSQPLRLLLLQKSQMEQHPEYERNLHQAATYMPDRTLLFLLIREYQTLETGESLFELEEERLELKALSEIFAERETRESTVPSPPEKDLYALLDLFREDDEPADVAAPVQTPVVETPPAPDPQPEPAPEPVISKTPPPKTKKPVSAPQPKSAFSSWKAAGSPLPAWESIPLPKIESEPESPVKPRELARKSVEEKEDIVSETLAGLLALQGHTQKAIQMYEKLCLIFPEKSSFFAQKIDKLKRK